VAFIEAKARDVFASFFGFQRIRIPDPGKKPIYLKGVIGETTDMLRRRCTPFSTGGEEYLTLRAGSDGVGDSRRLPGT